MNFKNLIKAFILILVTMNGCKRKTCKVEPDFFKEMKEKYEFPVNEYINYQFKNYFDEFGMAKEPYYFQGNCYYKLNNSPYNVVNISGYIRMEKEKIWILPIYYSEEKPQTEQLLLDFSAKPGTKWTTYFTSDSTSYAEISFNTFGLTKDKKKKYHIFHFYSNLLDENGVWILKKENVFCGVTLTEGFFYFMIIKNHSIVDINLLTETIKIR